MKDSTVRSWAVVVAVPAGAALILRRLALDGLEGLLKAACTEGCGAGVAVMQSGRRGSGVLDSLSFCFFWRGTTAWHGAVGHGSNGCGWR